MESVKVKLTCIQASAYWCVNIMRNKVKEINECRNASDNEIYFLDLFYSYTDIEWRNIYLELVGHFTEIAENESYKFYLDTELGGHDLLNVLVSRIINVDVPDIRLASDSVKDSVIDIKKDKAMIWYKSCGDMPLSLEYDADYILTGDKEELDFYNLVLATMIMLTDLDLGFRSISDFRKRFCVEYKKVNGLNDKLEDIFERFNRAFSKINERDLVTGSVYSKSFFPSITSMDVVSVEKYLDMGRHYADVILEREEVFPLPINNKLKKDYKE